MKTSLFFLYLFMAFTCVSQEIGTGKYPLVHVNDWGQKAYTLTEDFWKSTEKEIIDKVGEHLYKKIKYYSNNENIPNALLLYDGIKKVPTDERRKRLRSLKVYKVVEVTQIWEGTDYGKHVILAVPYQELYWDKSSKWDTIFFVIKAAALEKTSG